MKLKDLAEKLGREFRGDANAEIFSPAPVEAASPGMIIFVAVAKYASALKSSVTAAITTAELAKDASCATIISDNPYADFARVLEIFYPSYRPAGGIDASAKIAADAKIGAGASIGAFVSIGAGVTIGRDAVIHPNVTIYPNVTIGDSFIAHAGVVVREATVIGNRVMLKGGAVIGSEGFGFVEERGALVKIPQVGNVILEDEVEIGAKSTVDRATMGATILRRGVKLDDQVHIAHNCDIGEYTRMAGLTGIAGSVKIGKWCQFGGNSGCADHVTIGDRVLVVAKAGIHSDIKSDTIVSGVPAVEVHAFRRYAVVLTRLPEIIRRVRAIEKKMGSGGDDKS